MEVDWAGDPLYVTMKSNHWIEAHIHAYKYFGGVTRILIPDNLKIGIIKNTHTELILNQSYREMVEFHERIIFPFILGMVFFWCMDSPSISHRYCCGVSSITSTSSFGQLNLPPPSLLYNSRNPSPSHRIAYSGSCSVRSPKAILTSLACFSSVMQVRISDDLIRKSPLGI